MVQAVNLVPVAEHVAEVILPESTTGAPGKETLSFIGQIVFVVAFNKTNGSALFLLFTPGKKSAVNFSFITGQGDPQIKDIP
jgi:hypothetical protein